MCLSLFSDLIVTPNGLNVKGLLKKSGRPGARTPAWCPPLQTLFQYCTVLFCISLFFYCSNPIFSALHPDRITLFPNVTPPGECRRQEVGELEFLFVLFVGGLLILLGVGVQLRIRGGCRACYRGVRPLAVIDLNDIYFRRQDHYLCLFMKVFISSLESLGFSQIPVLSISPIEEGAPFNVDRDLFQRHQNLPFTVLGPPSRVFNES